MTPYPLQNQASMGSPARADLVLRPGREIAGVVALVQLSLRRPLARLTIRPRLTVTRSPHFFRPARQADLDGKLSDGLR
jgi:hypothetical protein